ncbi:MAG TPA: hypothetical protein VIK31_03230 [Propionibacteriaceae bacterium]
MRSRQHLYGRSKQAAAEQIRQHVLELGRQGMGWKYVASAGGVAPSTVSNLLYGRYPSDPSHVDYRPPAIRINTDAAARLLAVRLMHAPHTPIDSTGTRRRLQALVTLGWSVSELGRRLDKTPSNMHTMLQAAMILEATRRRVVALYDELWDTPRIGATHHERVAVSRAKNYAAAHRWAPPLAWDDDTIDDPDATPEGMLAVRPLSIHEQVVELLEIGCSVTELPSRVGARNLIAVIGAIRDPQLKVELRRRAS